MQGPGPPPASPRLVHPLPQTAREGVYTSIERLGRVAGPGGAPSGLARLAHLPQKPLGEVGGGRWVWCTVAGILPPAVGPLPPGPSPPLRGGKGRIQSAPESRFRSPSPAQFAGEGRGGG